MRPLIPLTVVAAVVGGILTGCSSDPAASALDQTASAAAADVAPGRVSVEQFATLIAKPGVKIVDVRTPEEFAAGHLAGAVNIPVQQPDFADRIAGLDPAATYAVYCRSSKRSRAAVTEMQAAGITGVYELDGGTVAWTAAGQPLTR